MWTDLIFSMKSFEKRGEKIPHKKITNIISLSAMSLSVDKSNCKWVKTWGQAGGKQRGHWEDCSLLKRLWKWLSQQKSGLCQKAAIYMFDGFGKIWKPPLKTFGIGTISVLLFLVEMLPITLRYFSMMAIGSSISSAAFLSMNGQNHVIMIKCKADT